MKTQAEPPAQHGSAIQVVVRLRPMNDKEKAVGVLPVVTAKTQEKTVTVIKGKGRKQIKSSYSFDNVFTAFSTQEEVFEATVKPVIVDVMRGFESTVRLTGVQSSRTGDQIDVSSSRYRCLHTAKPVPGKRTQVSELQVVATIYLCVSMSPRLK